MNENNNMEYDIASDSSKRTANSIDSFLCSLVPILTLIFYVNSDGFDKTFRYSLLAALIFYLLRDITGRSIGKKLVGLSIINPKLPGEKVSHLNLIIGDSASTISNVISSLFPTIKKNNWINNIAESSLVVRVHTGNEDVLPEEEFKSEIKEPIECIECGSRMEANENVCKKCGWSFKKD